MARRPIRKALWLVLALSTVALDACSSPPIEQQLLTTFFRAARVRDNTALASISAVNFDPRTDGTVQNFTIDGIGQPQHRDLGLQQLMDDEAEARSEQVEFTRRMRDYYNANVAAIDRVTKAQRANETVRGRDADVLAEWMKWDAESRDRERAVTQARLKAQRERATAVNSMTPVGREDVDVTGMQVDVITEEVKITAEVQSPEGQTTERRMTVTLQRASGKNGDETVEGRWIIMAIQSQDGTAPSS